MALLFTCSGAWTEGGMNRECYDLTRNKMAHIISTEIVWLTMNSSVSVARFKIENASNGDLQR